LNYSSNQYQSNPANSNYNPGQLPSNPTSQQQQQFNSNSFSHQQQQSTTPQGEEVVVEVQHQETVKDAVDWKARIANLMRENAEFHEQEEQQDSEENESNASSSPVRNTSGSNSMTNSYESNNSYGSNNTNPQFASSNSNPNVNFQSSSPNNPMQLHRQNTPPVGKLVYNPTNSNLSSSSGPNSPHTSTAGGTSSNPSSAGVGVALHQPARLQTSPTNSSASLVVTGPKPAMQTTSNLARGKLTSPVMVGATGTNAIHVQYDSFSFFLDAFCFFLLLFCSLFSLSLFIRFHILFSSSQKIFFCDLFVLTLSLMSSNPRSMVASPQQIAKLAQEKKEREEKEKDMRSRCEENERNIGTSIYC
jgi:hypothetical protein